MERKRNASRFHLTPEGWVAARAQARSGLDHPSREWSDRPPGAVETWEWFLAGESSEPPRGEQTWFNGRVHPGIRDGIRASFPPPVDGVL